MGATRRESNGVKFTPRRVIVVGVLAEGTTRFGRKCCACAVVTERVPGTLVRELLLAPSKCIHSLKVPAEVAATANVRVGGEVEDTA